MSKGSKARRQAIAQDVERRAWHAFSSGQHVNPYAQDDKRHVLFAQRLARILAIDHEVEDLNQAYGVDTRALPRRRHPHPGPVLPLESL